jgi:hypothetical protein
MMPSLLTDETWISGPIAADAIFHVTFLFFSLTNAQLTNAR